MSEHEPKPDVRRQALRNPLELCLSAANHALRTILARYGETMFNRGVRYERERMERLYRAATSAPPPPNEAQTDELEFDPDRTPPRGVRVWSAEELRVFDFDQVSPANEAVVLPREPDPRQK